LNIYLINLFSYKEVNHCISYIKKIRPIIISFTYISLKTYVRDIYIFYKLIKEHNISTKLFITLYCSLPFLLSCMRKAAAFATTHKSSPSYSQFSSPPLTSSRSKINNKYCVIHSIYEMELMRHPIVRGPSTP